MLIDRLVNADTRSTLLRDLEIKSSTTCHALAFLPFFYRWTWQKVYDYDRDINIVMYGN